MPSVHATIARRPFALTREGVEATMRAATPEAIREHYAVIGGRRFPPKQVVATVTGLDRSEFISTQARSVLERLGFTVGRLGTPPTRRQVDPTPSEADQRIEREAEMLRPYRGQFVAVDPDWTEVVASGPDPRSVNRAVRAIGRSGVVFQVPIDPALDVGSFAW